MGRRRGHAYCAPSHRWRVPATTEKGTGRSGPRVCVLDRLYRRGRGRQASLYRIGCRSIGRKVHAGHSASVRRGRPFESHAEKGRDGKKLVSNPFRRFVFSLALKMGRTVRELLDALDVAELQEWVAFYEL